MDGYKKLMKPDNSTMLPLRFDFDNYTSDEFDYLEYYMC